MPSRPTSRTKKFCGAWACAACLTRAMPHSIPACADNDPLLGQRISDAIAEQMKIVRAKYPKAQFVTDLWQEGARLMQEGYLKIPPEVTLVWADTGYGDMQDGGKVAAGQGAVLPRRHDERPGESAVRDGACRGHPVGTGPLHQGRRHVVRAGEHQRHSPRRHEHASGDGDCLGRPAGRIRRWRRRLLSPTGPPKSSVRNPQMRLPRVYQEYFAAPPRVRRLGRPGSRRPATPPPPPPPLSSKSSGMNGDQHYHSEIRRLLLDELSEHQVIADSQPVAQVDAAARAA